MFSSQVMVSVIVGIAMIVMYFLIVRDDNFRPSKFGFSWLMMSTWIVTSLMPIHPYSDLRLLAIVGGVIFLPAIILSAGVYWYERHVEFSIHFRIK